MSTRPFGATATFGWRVCTIVAPGRTVPSLICFGVDHVAPLFSERWNQTCESGGMKWSEPW